MLDLRPTPARLSAAAAEGLPRAALLALVLFFILPGLFDRSLWTQRETQSLAEALLLLRGDPGCWLAAGAERLQAISHGPLAAWTGALLIGSFGALAPLAASRLSALLWYVLTVTCLWYGTWYLARRREAQPGATPFDRQASFREYGRLVADSSSLFLLSLFGLALRLRQPGWDTAALAVQALLFFACCWSLTRPYFGSVLAGLALTGLTLAGGLGYGITAALALCAILLLVPGRGRAGKKTALALTAALLSFACWPLLARLAGDAAWALWRSWWAAQLALPAALSWTDLSGLCRHALWQLCPAWPFAVLGAWCWWQRRGEAFIAVPLIFLAAWLAQWLLSPDRALSGQPLSCALPVCVLASFGLVAARRSFRGLLDSYSLASGTIALLGAWTVWLSWAAGAPRWLARNVSRYAPLSSPFDGGIPLLLMALAATLIWVLCCWRRLTRGARCMWYGPWLAGLGMTALWLVCWGAFGPAIGERAGYGFTAPALF